VSGGVRLVTAPLEIDFDLGDRSPEEFEREFQRLSETDEDPIGQWLKIALTQIVKNEEPERVPLAHHGHIESIGFEHFRLSKPLLEKGKRYYGRIAMPVFPKRDVAVWFDAIDERLAKIGRMHERDIKEWNSYVTARERIMIREMKRK